MRTEFREVTVKQPVYIADDGTEFEDEEDCQEYEFNSLEKSLMLYDENCEKTDKVDECYFVNLVTDVDVQHFIEVITNYGTVVKGIDGPGLYMYGPIDSWINLDDVVVRIRGGLTDDQT